MRKRFKKMALNSGIQTNRILTHDSEVCIPRLSSILLAVPQGAKILARSLILRGQLGLFFMLPLKIVYLGRRGKLENIFALHHFRFV